MPFFIENPVTEAEKFLMRIETELKPGLITQMEDCLREQLEAEDNTYLKFLPEHFAAALFIQATKQDGTPLSKIMRTYGYAILKHCGH